MASLYIVGSPTASMEHQEVSDFVALVFEKAEAVIFGFANWSHVLHFGEDSP